MGGDARYRFDAPTTEFRPAPTDWIQARVVVPLLRSLISAVATSLALAYLSWWLQDKASWILSNQSVDRWPTVLAYFPSSFCFCFFLYWVLHAIGIERLELFLVRVLGRAEPPPEPTRAAKGNVGHIILDSWKGDQAAEEAARFKERALMEQFIEEAWKNPTTRNLNRAFGPTRWLIWRQKLLDTNWAEWDEPGRPNSQWHLRADPKTTIAGLYATEDKKTRG